MSALLDRSKVCRCCHSQGILKYLNESFSHNGQSEIYSDMIRQAFNIEIKECPNISYSICEVCIPRLCDAFIFSRQVISCEQLIYQYYSTQYKDKALDYKHEIKIEFSEEEFERNVECHDSNICDQSDDGSFNDDQPLSTLKDNYGQIEPSEVNIGNDTDSDEYESGAPGTSNKKKVRTEIVDIKCVTTYSRQDFKRSEDQSTDNESQRGDCRDSLLKIIGDIVMEDDTNRMEVVKESSTIDHEQKPKQIIGVSFHTAPKSSIERGSEHMPRISLLKQQSKQRQDPDAVVEIAREDMRSAGNRTMRKKANSAEAGHKIKQAKTPTQRSREYRERKKLKMLLSHNTVDHQVQKKRAKTSAERSREHRERIRLVKKKLLEQQTPQDLDLYSTSSLANAVGQKNQAKTSSQRTREHRERKKLAMKTLLELQSEQDLDTVST